MDSFTSLSKNISADIYQELKTALELGKWKDGSGLNEKHKEISLQLVIAYESLHLKEEDRTAYIPPKVHEPCDDAQSLSKTGGPDHSDEQVIKFK